MRKTILRTISKKPRQNKQLINHIFGDNWSMRRLRCPECGFETYVPCLEPDKWDDRPTCLVVIGNEILK